MIINITSLLPLMVIQDKIKTKSLQLPNTTPDRKWFLLLKNVVLLTLYSIDTHFDASTTYSCKDCGKRRNCSWRAISPFPTMFSTQSDNCIPICSYFWHHAAELEDPKTGISGKGLNICLQNCKISTNLRKYVTMIEWCFMLLSTVFQSYQDYCVFSGF